MGPTKYILGTNSLRMIIQSQVARRRTFRTISQAPAITYAYNTRVLTPQKLQNQAGRCEFVGPVEKKQGEEKMAKKDFAAAKTVEQAPQQHAAAGNSEKKPATLLYDGSYGRHAFLPLFLG